MATTRSTKPRSWPISGRSISELRPADKEAFTAAIGEVESALEASRGGWTTQPVATVAARLCPQEMPVISVVP